MVTKKENNKKTITFYFQVHQPFRIRHYGVFDIGSSQKYFDEKKNREIVHKVARKCYLPTNRLLLDLLKKYKKFRVSFSISGVAVEQFERYHPELMDSFKRLFRHSRVELLSETYYHSLAFLYSKKEFVEQVEKHRSLMKELFHKEPKVFRNTELIYNNELAKFVEEMGYKGILAEGADHILGWRSPNYVYKAKNSDIRLLLKNYRLSDDIAFRFSNKGWEEYPLTVEKYIAWLLATEGYTINLFMDYETFGEHQWAETGIFQFLANLPEAALKAGIGFTSPSQLIKKEPVGELDYPYFVSWADMERDLSAWLGNALQMNAIREIYALEKYIKKTGDKDLIEKWRKLQTSDHFYYMCTKWFSDGDVHKYFNPYDSPYDGFISYMNVLNDLSLRIKQRIKARSSDLNDSFSENLPKNITLFGEIDEKNESEKGFILTEHPSLMLRKSLGRR